MIYNLRGSGLNVEQPSYNSLVMHNSFLYMIAHMWNQLPAGQILDHIDTISLLFQ